MTKTEIKRLVKHRIISAVSEAGYVVYDNPQDYPLTEDELEYFDMLLNKYENTIYRILNNTY